MEKLFMMVTSDKYELPLAVADSLAELAKMVGVKAQSIRSAINHYESGRIKTCKY